MRGVVVALALTACGGSLSATGDGGVPDARPSGDAAPRCEVHVQVTPSNPVAPQALAATAVVTGALSFVSAAWRVTGPEGDVDFQTLDTSGLRISFTAAVAGPYDIALSAEDGARPCMVDSPTVNVGAPGANTTLLRLRYIPRPDQPAPPQDDLAMVTVPGGADYALPARRVLAGGVAVSGTIAGPAGGVAAYLRLDSPLTRQIELFTDTAGHFSASVPQTVFSALVVPYGAAIAPRRFVMQLASDLSHGFTLDAGDAVTGTLLDGAAAPVAGARLALGAGTLPPVVVTTAADGSFTARVRTAEGALAAVAVTDSDRIDVTTDLGVHVTAGARLELRLAAAEPVPLAVGVVTAGGAPLPGARVTFVADDVPPGGSIRVNGGAPVVCPASAHVVAVAGAGGALPALSLPRAAWQATIEPPPGSDEVLGSVAFDLAADTPTSLATSVPRAARVSVRAGGAAVEGAAVTVTARGLHGVGAGAAAQATTGAGGEVNLALVPGMTYDVTVDPPAGARLARARAILDGAAAALTVATSPALVLSGTVTFPSGAGQAGVRVEAFCVGCDDPTRPLAETVTGAGGAFALVVPDPGLK